MNDQSKLIGGAAAIAAAIVLGILIFSGGDDDNGGGGGNGPVIGLACTLGVGGAVALAEGLLRNKNASAIITQIGGPAGGVGCTTAITALVDTPDEPVDLTIEQEDGTGLEETVTGSELQAPAPQTAGSGLQRAIDCLGWKIDYFYRACVDGRLNPTS